jgi:hypothetical protein
MESVIVVHKPKCIKCGREFSTHQMLIKHSKRKTPCNRVIECTKCLKKFKQPSDLERHYRRITPCEPIQGNPCDATPVNACHFCKRQLSNKACLRRHFNVCKIKNGGMALLFEKVERLTKINEKLMEKMDRIEQKENTQNGNQNINGNNNIIQNHFNTTINIPIVCFMGDEHVEKMRQIVEDNLGILYSPIETDIPHQEQITCRIGEFVEAIYRNPEHKELQNVYTKHDFEQSNKNNAFTYGVGKRLKTPSWHIGDWDNISKDILNKIYDALLRANVKNKKDMLKTMNTIMSAAGIGDQKISDENLQELYCEIGRRMGFSTLVLED